MLNVFFTRKKNDVIQTILFCSFYYVGKNMANKFRKILQCNVLPPAIVIFKNKEVDLAQAKRSLAHQELSRCYLQNLISSSFMTIATQLLDPWILILYANICYGFSRNALEYSKRNVHNSLLVWMGLK